MTKCKNCINGKVDGGFKVRVSGELKNLEVKKSNEIFAVKEKNTDKKKKIISDIREKYDVLISAKEKETSKKGICSYCKGQGHR